MNRRAVLATIALFAAACGGGGEAEVVSGSITDPEPTPTGSEASALADARARWDASGVDDYVMTTTEVCFCPLLETTVTVRGGAVVEAVGAGDLPDDPTFAPEARTVEDLFTEVEEALALDPFDLQVTYDPETGRVVSYFVDLDERVADEEYGVEVIDFRPSGVGPTTPTPVVDASTLVDPLPCGYGFQAGRPDQTAAVFVRPVDLDLADARELPAESPAVGGAWRVEVQVGSNLFANWCDDVIEPDEPVPEVAERWVATEGLIRLLDELPPPGQYGAPVTAALDGLVVERPDGSTQPLGDLLIVNDCWGCLAG